MQKLLCLLVFTVASSGLLAQKKTIEALEAAITKNEIEAHLSFLAADDMRGRQSGSRELSIAANYIKAYFAIQGLSPAPGTQGFFQPVDLVKNYPPSMAIAQVGQQQFAFKDNLLVLNGDSISWTGDLVYVGYGSAEDLKKVDIKDKMVLALAGARDADNLNKVFTASSEKHTAVQKAGGLGLVEILTMPQAPWPTLVNYLTQTVWDIKRETRSLIPHVWLKPSDIGALKFQEGENVTGSLIVHGRRQVLIPGKNVAALIEGTDSKLKDEYVIITAHYDHIGVGQAMEGDSIFNGARDNAIGTVALLQTAKYLVKNPPKHSVLLVALTSEEKGMLGSKWYTEHPLVPLEKHVLAINCDGVGFNDKSIITSISFGRTNTDEHVTKAAQAFGLKVGGDPDPKENFFERSDQVSFARKGIPAIKLQPGLAKMDDEIRKYYHRQADEVSSLDLDYLTKFYRSFVYAVYLLTNETQRPAWKPGDKFEETSKKLYSGTK